MIQKTAHAPIRPNFLPLLLISGLICSILALSVRSFYYISVSYQPEHDSDAMMDRLDVELQSTPGSQRGPLILKYTQSAEYGLRYAAIDALEEQKGKETVTAVEKAFGDNASMVRQRAVEILSKIDDRRGLRLLLIALQDEDQWIRQAAIQQLVSLTRPASASVGKRGELYKNAVPGLIAALSDEDDVVAVGAMGVLRKVVGKPWYASTKAAPAQRREMKARWENWWKEAQPTWPIALLYRHLSAVRPTRSDPAPDFALKDIEGHKWSLATQKGHVTLLNFWGTWCAPCRGEAPDLQKIDTLYRHRGVDTIGVALAEENGASSLRRFAGEHHLSYRQTLATDKVLKQFGDIHEVPVSVLIDKKGQIRYRWEGERDFATFRAAVDRLLSEPD